MTTADSPPLFDRLRYVDRLTNAGIAADQARAHADAMEDALRSGVATKAGLKALETALRSEMLAMEYRLTVRGGLMAAAVVAILASLKFF
jgi:hypothetical protein